MVEYFEPRGMVLDGQSVSGDTDQSSIDLTNVNKEANTQFFFLPFSLFFTFLLFIFFF